MHKIADIVIVGAGPIGLSMCQALAGTGLDILLIEKQSQQKIANPAPDGREIAITHRTKAIMQDLHQWQRVDKNDIHLLKKAHVYNGTSDFVLGFDKPDTVRGRAVETLGYLISNYIIRQVAYDTVADAFDDKITALFEKVITHVEKGELYTTLVLSDGVKIRSRLVIAADSRMSFMRKALGISADMHDFGRTVMVFRTEHTKSNHSTAHEGFYYGKTLAVLPLGEYQSSMVITVDNSQVAQLTNMNKQRLAATMEEWLGGRLGQMTVTSSIYSYPLVGVHARGFYSHRAAVIGDAAVGMHPVTAHGYNLGMESVQLLSDLICQAVVAEEDIASHRLLRYYSHMHTLKTRAMYHGTNTIVKLYTNETPPARFMRHTGLRLSNSFIPLKKLITGQLTG